jgi:protein O-mannosyl-transferase
VLSYSANYMYTGMNPAGFHLVNTCVHLLNGLLVYYLALSLRQDEPHSDRFALVAALFFLLHPLNSEAVMWISARPDLLCTFFFLLASILLVKHKDNATLAALGCLFLAFMASLCAKEAAISMVAIAPIFLYFESRKGNLRHVVLLSSVVFFSTALYLFLRSGRHVALDKGIGSVVTSITAKGKEHPSIFDAVAAYGFYLKKLVYPFPLNFTITEFDKTTAFACLLLALVVLYALLRWNRSFLLPSLIILAGIVPPVLAYIGNIPWTPLGERYLYLPMVGFSLLISMVTAQVQRVPFIVTVVLVLLLAVPTIERVGLWCDAKAFWNDALDKSPKFAKSYSALGAEYFEEGNYIEAERNMKKAISLGYGKPVIWQNLARVYAAKKDYLNYESAMLKAASRSQYPTPIYQDMIMTLLPAYQKIDAAVGYRKAITYNLLAQQKDPTYLEASYNVGKLYYVLGDMQNAEYYLSLYAEKAKGGLYRPFALRMIRKIQESDS